MKTIKEYLLENYDIEGIKNIYQNGCYGGVSGLISYAETCAFHDEFQNEIWNMLYDDAESEGVSILELLSEFNNQQNVISLTQLKNMLYWYAVERVSTQICEDS